MTTPAEMFQKLSQIYQILSDPAARVNGREGICSYNGWVGGRGKRLTKKFVICLLFP